MKIEKTQHTTAKYLTATAHLLGIKEHEFVAQNGTANTIIVLETDAGNFSNFKSIWEKQSINVEQIDEGQEVEITYVQHIDSAKNRIYKNFKFVKLAS